MIKKILLSVSTILLLSTNSKASGIPTVDVAAIQTSVQQMAQDFSLDQAMQEFQKKLEEASLKEGLMTGNASIKGQQAYDTALKNASSFGGAYGKDAANIMKSCFDISLPSFSAGLGIKGLDFCGIDSLDNMRKSFMKGKSTSFDQETLDKFKEKMSTIPGTKVNGKVMGSKVADCVPGLASNPKKCEADNKKIIEKELKEGTTNGAASVAATREVAKTIVEAKEGEKDEVGNAKDEICTRDEKTGGTTASVACNQSTVQTLMNINEKEEDLNSSSSILTGQSDVDNIKKNMRIVNENSMKKATDRNNEFFAVRDDYNIKYNPSVFAIEDVNTNGGNATYNRLKAQDQLSLDTTMYIVPQIKDDKFTFGKYGIDNYDQAINDFNNIELTDPEGQVKANGDKDSVKKTINRLGGVTPFSSALYGYEGIVSVMAKNLYSNGEENGELGRELAIINGLKGTMYQTLMLNQQLENKARADYNIRVKEFDKLSADNDMINNNLELIQNQNAMLIKLLTDLNNNIKKLQK